MSKKEEKVSVGKVLLWTAVFGLISFSAVLGHAALRRAEDAQVQADEALRRTENESQVLTVSLDRGGNLSGTIRFSAQVDNPAELDYAVLDAITGRLRKAMPKDGSDTTPIQQFLVDPPLKRSDVR